MLLKQIIFFFLIVLAQQGSAYYNEPKYEGLPKYQMGPSDIDTRLKIIDSYLPKAPIVFEAGAYHGNDSVKMASMWPEGKILSFEPNPSAFNLYQKKAKNYSNMFGYNLAVNNYNGTATFYLCWGTGGKDPVFEGASSLLTPSAEMRKHYMGPEVEVRCVILDDWCRDNKVKNIDFMWLDLEGFELQLLKSSPAILKTVKVIYTETNFFHFRQGTTPYNELKEFLNKQGFNIIAHWYNEGLQGDAIFVRKELIN